MVLEYSTQVTAEHTSKIRYTKTKNTNSTIRIKGYYTGFDTL